MTTIATESLTIFFFPQWNYRRAGQDTLRTSVPQIDEELAESLRVLAELEARLPVIRLQAIKIQLMYDSGRQKVRKRTPFPLFSFPLFLIHRTDRFAFVPLHLIGRSAGAGSPMAKPRLVRALVPGHLHV